MKKKVLFIDRDGTLVIEPPVDYQLDSLEKLEFYPKIFRNLGFIRSKLDFEFVMVTNQDGLGTSSFPEETFWPAHNLMLKTLEGEGITFDEILIDRSFPEDNAPTRKPRTGMLTKYLNNPEYDLAGSFVIGDRPTDVELAKNMGCRAIYLQNSPETLKEKGLEEVCALATTDWDQIAEFLFAGERKAEVRRTTKETDIDVALNLNGNGTCDISTGLGFFDHMLEQIGKHSGMDLTIRVKGDLEVDEHHTIEDTAIALGECIYQALGSKRGIERYGYALPMDDCLCQVCLDFGGRPWLVWDAEFKREKIGEMPTEMFLHFFKSLSDAAKMNLNIKADDPPVPNTAYGLSKLKAELYIQSMPGFPYVIYRPTGVYGPREADYYLMAKSIQKHVDFSVGFRRQDLTFVYVKDIVQAIFLGIEKKVVRKAYFLTDGKVYKSRAFSDLIQKELGNPFVLHLKCPLIVLKVISLFAEFIATRSGRSSTLNSDKYKIMKQRNWQCDITPVMDELGYVPEYDLEKGVRETIAWYKNEGWL